MNIVVLDGYTLNPGDLSWEALQALGNCTIYERTAPEDVVTRAQDAEVLLVNKVEISQSVMERLPDLRYIGVMATGYNVIDTEFARKQNIVVTNVPTYGTDSVAQMVLAHVLNYTQRVAHHSRTVKEERWSRNPDFCYWDYPLIELNGLSFGVIGYGRIGRATAKLAAAFGMRVLVHHPHPIAPEEPVEAVSLAEVFRQSDFLSLHCPLTPDNHHLVNKERIGWMKPTAVVINTSRGGLVDASALAEALTGGRIAAACLDVLEEEPPPANHPLFEVENCFITPHIAWASQAARSRLLQTVVENIRAYQQGDLVNVISD